MTTLGKIIGGGMPLAAYGGKAEIMDKVSPQGPVYQAGTLSGNPIATTAGIETLRILKAHPEYYTQIDESAKQIAQALRNWAGKRKDRCRSIRLVRCCVRFIPIRRLWIMIRQRHQTPARMRSISDICLTTAFTQHRHSLRRCLYLRHIRRKILSRRAGLFQKDHKDEYTVIEYQP